MAALNPAYVEASTGVRWLKSVADGRLVGFVDDTGKQYRVHAVTDADGVLPSESTAVGVVTVDAITAVNATALGLVDGDVVVARGRSAAGDGGGGTFRYSAASTQTVDGGLVFQPTAGSGRLFREGWTVLGFNGKLNVRWFGALGNGSADDYPACNSALLAAIEFGGGTVYFPQGDFPLSATLTQGNALVPIYYEGAGPSFQGQAGIGTIVRGTHTNGAVIARSYFGGGISRMTIDSSTARRTSSYVALNCGILDLNSNQLFDQSISWEADQVFVRNQPGHGIISLNYWKAATIKRCRITDNKGHGIYLAKASDLGLPYTTHESRGGGLSITQNLIFRCGGHAVCTGNFPSGNSTYRVEVEDNDISFCATDAAVRLSAHALHIYSENAEIHRNGIGGYDATTGLPVVAGMYVDGTEPRITSNRFIDCATYGIELGANADGAVCENQQVFNATATTLTELVRVTAGCTGVFVRQASLAFIDRVMTAAPNNTGNTAIVNGRQLQGFKSRLNPVTIADDAVTAITFSTTATYGTIDVMASSSTVPAPLMKFRVGDAFSFALQKTALANVSGAVTGTVPTGTTGTDGNLNFFAMNNAPVLYIENRTGASITVMFTVMSMATGELV